MYIAGMILREGDMVYAGPELGPKKKWWNPSTWFRGKTHFVFVANHGHMSGVVGCMRETLGPWELLNEHDMWELGTAEFDACFALLKRLGRIT